ALMWAGFGLAFLTKGPPGLLPLLAVFAFDALTPATQADGSRRPRALQWWGPLLLLAVALPWYLAVVLRTPGLLDYFLGAEVVDWRSRSTCASVLAVPAPVVRRCCTARAGWLSGFATCLPRQGDASLWSPDFLGTSCC